VTGAPANPAPTKCPTDRPHQFAPIKAKAPICSHQGPTRAPTKNQGPTKAPPTPPPMLPPSCSHQPATHQCQCSHQCFHQGSHWCSHQCFHQPEHPPGLGFHHKAPPMPLSRPPPVLPPRPPPQYYHQPRPRASGLGWRTVAGVASARTTYQWYYHVSRGQHHAPHTPAPPLLISAHSLQLRTPRSTVLPPLPLSPLDLLLHSLLLAGS
jgi:hypothetical protein